MTEPDPNLSQTVVTYAKFWDFREFQPVQRFSVRKYFSPTIKRRWFVYVPESDITCLFWNKKALTKSKKWVIKKSRFWYWPKLCPFQTIDSFYSLVTSRTKKRQSSKTINIQKRSIAFSAKNPKFSLILISKNLGIQPKYTFFMKCSEFI